MPKISVIIPLYNKGLHIARALESVLTQTFQDFEIIVIDGGSTDGGDALVRQFSDHRTRLIYQTGTGVSTARNQGVEAASGEFIAFLDADDEWFPDHLDTLWRLLNAYPGAGVVGTDYKIQGHDGTFTSDLRATIPDSPWEGLIPRFFYSAATGERLLLTSFIGMPKEIFSKVGGFNVAYGYAEDADLWGRVAVEYDIVYSRKCGGIYHTDATNRVEFDHIPLTPFPFEETAEKVLCESELPPVIRADLNEYLARLKLDRANRIINSGHPKTARPILAGCGTRLLWKDRCWWTFWAYMPPTLFRIVRSGKRKVQSISR